MGSLSVHQPDGLQSAQGQWSYVPDVTGAPVSAMTSDADTAIFPCCPGMTLVAPSGPLPFECPVSEDGLQKSVNKEPSFQFGTLLTDVH